jgi:carboxylesterase
MHIVGKGLHRAGFSIYGMQLAGHCGSMEDLLQTDQYDWYNSVKITAERFREGLDHLFVVGLSMGALLALKLAAEFPHWISGVGVYGATFCYDGWATPWYAKLPWLLPMLLRLGIGKHRILLERTPYSVRDKQEWAQISPGIFHEDSLTAGLASEAWPLLEEMRHIANQVRQLLPWVTPPCLIAHASKDDVASTNNAYLVQCLVSGPVDILLLPNSCHMITIDHDHGILIERTIDFFSRIATSYGPSTHAAA